MLFLISEHKQKATDLDHDRTEESLKFLQRLSKANKTDGQTTKAVSWHYILHTKQTACYNRNNSFISLLCTHGRRKGH